MKQLILIVVKRILDRREAGFQRGKSRLDDLGGDPSGVMTMTSTSSRISRTQSNRSRSLTAGNFESSEKISETEELAPEETMEVEAERTMVQDNDKRQEPRRNENLIAYPPIPTKCFIKEEPRNDDDHSGESQIIAYPPISLSAMAIKEELTAHEEISFGIQHQVMQQQGGGRNLVNQSEAKNAPNVCDSQSAADHAGNGTKRLQATKLKRSSTVSRPTQQTTEEEMGSNSRTLQIRSEMFLSSTMDHGKAAGKRMETDKLTVEQNDRPEDHLCDATAGEISEHSSMKDKNTALNSSYSDDVEPVAVRSKAGPSRPRKKAADHHEPGFERGKISKRKRSSAVYDVPIAGPSADSSFPDHDKDPEPELSYTIKGKKHTMKKRAGPIGSSDELVDNAEPSSELKLKATERSTSKANHRPEGKAPARPFKCINCERPYAVKKLLNRHVMHECNVEPKFRCQKCDHHFAQKFNLKKHLLNVHKIDPSQLAANGYEPKERPVHPFKCGKCERTYKLKSGLSNHEKFECGVDPAFPCTLCDFRTALKGNLRVHLVHVHQVAPSDLDHFQAAALVARPDNPFKCEQCGRSYKEKTTLRRHLIHECGMEKSLKCPHCDFRTKTKSHINSHVKNVHGEGPAFISPK